MKKIIEIAVCDHCGAEIKGNYKIITNYDLCEACAPKLELLIAGWVNYTSQEEKDQNEANTKPVTIEEEIIENGVVLEETKETKVKKSATRKASVDWNQACKLKQEGWSNSEIAYKLRTSVANINSNIYRRLSEYNQGVRFEVEE